MPDDRRDQEEAAEEAAEQAAEQAEQRAGLRDDAPPSSAEEQLEEALSALHDGALPRDEAEALRARVAREPELEARLTEYARLDDALGAIPAPALDRGRMTALRERIAAEVRADEALRSGAGAPAPVSLDAERRRRRGVWMWPAAAALAAGLLLYVGLGRDVTPSEREARPEPRIAERRTPAPGAVRDGTFEPMIEARAPARVPEIEPTPERVALEAPVEVPRTPAPASDGAPGIVPVPTPSLEAAIEPTLLAERAPEPRPAPPNGAAAEAAEYLEAHAAPESSRVAREPVAEPQLAHAPPTPTPEPTLTPEPIPTLTPEPIPTLTIPEPAVARQPVAPEPEALALAPPSVPDAPPAEAPAPEPDLLAPEDALLAEVSDEDLWLAYELGLEDIPTDDLGVVEQLDLLEFVAAIDALESI